MSDKFKIFRHAVTRPEETAGGTKRKIIGHLCSYTPEELVYAAGFHPMRLFSSKSDILHAEEHLQAYCCSLVRGVLEDSLAGRLDYLSGAVFPHTCDSIQRLSDIWRLEGKYEFFADLVVPAKLNTQSARTYMIGILNRFKTDLENAKGKPISNQDILNSIKLFNTIRKALTHIYALQSGHPGIIKGSDLFTLVRGTMVMDKEKAAELLCAITKELESAPKKETDAKRLILSGAVCDSPNIYETIEQSGGVVVGDDLCTGQRWFEGPVAEDRDPVAAIADRYLSRINCPAKHATATSRADHLVQLAKRTKARGIIFLLLKFCDPHAFDYPYIKEALEKEGIKTLLIEMDEQQESFGQLSTRIETFIHMI